ncbi:hypothetical protein LTR78_001917 [Recurvomyces mirabilis]|uniref:DUF3835 domain-containing protein n=1 Tax=Recurvomyces mirabilis TaxID=574656 RepID=A0AAE1C5D2_9PEZI|nr:hypothetical protein LTR78_001917 [Recurvomyces mirabilis]KAK5156644.1 hypothetical protein LTS14_004856 [Recurvomyces mirabilis]
MADLTGLEQQRQALEESLQKLRQSLKHWQTFEAEYEGLKEELEAAEPPVDADALTKIAKTYDGRLVDEEVVRELSGLDKGPVRTAPQIIRDIERRQEYVQKNIETLQRRFFADESQLETFDFAATRDAETGLPLTEIEEELDDDDNVISSRVHQPEESQSNLVDSLRKAGLTSADLGEAYKIQTPLKSAITNAIPPIPSTPAVIAADNRIQFTPDIPSTEDSTMDPDENERPPIRKKSVSFSADTKKAPEMVRLDSDDGKKSVSFAEKVAVAPAAPLPDPRTVQFSPQVEEIPVQPLGPPSPSAVTPTQAGASDPEKQKELRASFKPGDRVKMLGDDDEVVEEEIVMPENETEDDAKLRREMLDYHLHEVGHIVAQMDLDDNDYYNDDDDEEDDTSSHFTGSTRMEDEDTPYTSNHSDEEDEDEHGRSKSKVVTDDYRKQMLEMQDRLIGNLGPAPEEPEIADLDDEINPKDVRKLVIRDKRNSVSSASSENDEKKISGKKRVSFAEELDVAQPGSPPLKARKQVEGQAVSPLADGVPERKQGGADIEMIEAKSANTSRFMQSGDLPATQSAPGSSALDANLGDHNDSPMGPAGRTLADTLVERQPTSGKTTQAPSEDDMDPITERRQLAAEYYRRRNEMVRQQGGFKVDPDEEEEFGELMEERDGKIKKVSRFRAARLKG